MDNKLLLSLIVPALDNRVLEAFAGTALWSIVSELVSSDYYWYQRVQYLSTREIAYRSGGDWKAAYYLLSDVIHLRDPFMRDVVYNLLAMSVLIEIGFDPSIDGGYILNVASREGHTEVVRLLLKDGRVDPRADDSHVLTLSAAGGYIEVVRLLLEDDRVDPSDGDSCALRMAAFNRHAEVVRLLLEDRRADPRAINIRVLRLDPGCAEVIGLLLEDGRADVEIGEGR